MKTPTATASRGHWRRAGAGVLVALVLAGVFMLYTRPEFMLRMADHVWACF